MHISVDKAGSSPGGSFLEYVNDLESAGFITAGLKPVVDQVRQRGNIANHELPSLRNKDSLLTLTITEHLLEGMYELPGMVTPAPASTPTQDLKELTKDPAARDHLEPSKSLDACGRNRRGVSPNVFKRRWLGTDRNLPADPLLDSSQ